VVTTDGTPRSDLAKVEALVTATGARAMRMTAIEHDLAVAAISHVPLIAAAALVESIATDPARWSVARPLAAGGWRDMTRLARGDSEMGADIVATNARPIASQLRAYRNAIDGWLRELDAIINEASPAVPDADGTARLRARLEKARSELEREPTP
jgi:prephenate dehydrogenase